MKVLIIVPAYNEEDSILTTIADLQQHASFADIIVINDCSRDNTKALLDAHGIDYIDLPINLGINGGVQTGYRYAWINGYDYAIQFDGDGQHKAMYIKDLLKKSEQGYDIVIGSRFLTKPKNHTMRMMGSRLISFLIKILTGNTIYDPTSGMRMLNRKMIYDYAYNMNRHPEPDTVVYQLRHGAKVAEVQVEMQDRFAGKSLYSNWFNSFKYMFYQVISILFLSY